MNFEPHPCDFVETHDEAYSIIRGINKPWAGYEYCCPHTFHISEGKGDIRRMITQSAPKLNEVHVADAYNHLFGDGNRYIVNPPGVDARVHQHNEIGRGDVNWTEVFDSLREINFDGVMSVCIFGWIDEADEVNKRVLQRLKKEMGQD